MNVMLDGAAPPPAPSFPLFVHKVLWNSRSISSGAAFAGRPGEVVDIGGARSIFAGKAELAPVGHIVKELAHLRRALFVRYLWKIDVLW